MIIGGDVDLCDGMIVCEVDRGRPVAVPDLPTGAFSMLSDRVEVFYLTWCRGPSCETDIEGGACPIWFRRLGYFMDATFASSQPGGPYCARFVAQVKR